MGVLARVKRRSRAARKPWLTRAARMASALGSTGPHDTSALLQAAVPATLEEAAAASAIDTALWDLEAQESQSRLVDALGGAKRAMVPIYANINRRTKDRSPEGFAHSLHDASLAGFDALKIAPFDEITTEACASGQGAAAMRAGLARVAAAREAAGPRAASWSTATGGSTKLRQRS